MSPDIEHMLTNITLWLSSKPCGDFILHSPEPQESRIIRVDSFNYNSAREKIVNYLQSLGTIDNIHYSHKYDCYYIYIMKEDKDHSGYDIVREYVLYDAFNNIIEV